MDGGLTSKSSLELEEQAPPAVESAEDEATGEQPEEEGREAEATLDSIEPSLLELS